MLSTVSLKKKQIVVAIGLIYGVASAQAVEPKKVETPLYVEDGNIQVSQTVKTNPMGGTSIEYIKTKINDSTNEEGMPAAVNVEQVDSTTFKQTAVKEFKVVPKQDVLLTEHSTFKTKPINLVVETPVKQTIINPENMPSKAQALLAKIKAKKSAETTQTVPTEMPLKLTPNEILVPLPSQEKPKKTVNKVGNQQENAIISRLEFTQANVLDVARALADISGLNFVATEEAAKKSVTVFLQNITVKNALEAITKNSGLWYRKDKDSGTYRIMSTKEYQQDLVVYREDTTRVFDLLHPNPIIIATAVRDLYGDRVVLSMGAQDMFGLNGGMAGGMASNQGGQGSQVNSNAAGGNRRTVQGRGRRGGNTQTSSFGGNGSNRSANGKNANDSNRVLTVDQLQKLDSIIADKGDTALNVDDLKGIQHKQQPIFVTLNQEHDLMIVRTSDNSVMRDIEQLVKELDRPTKQVLLEMKILSLDVGDSYRQAMDLDYMPNSQLLQGPETNQAKNPLGTFAPDQVSRTREFDDGNGNTETVSSSGVRRFGVSNILGLGNFALEGGTFVYQFLSNKIRARIQLMQQNNRINTLSSPILLTSNNKPARMFVGTEQVVTTGFDAIAGGASISGVGTPAIVPITELRNIGNTLQVLPKINADKTVTLMIQQDSSTLVRGASAIPIPVGNNILSFNVDSVRTSNIQGTVQARDGLTIAIGGLIDSSDSYEEQKIPVLGDFPIIGEFFKRKVEQKSKRELLLLITPHIIESPRDAEDLTRDAVEPLTEQEW